MTTYKYEDKYRDKDEIIDKFKQEMKDKYVKTVENLGLHIFVSSKSKNEEHYPVITVREISNTGSDQKTVMIDQGYNQSTQCILKAIKWVNEKNYSSFNDVKLYIRDWDFVKYLNGQEYKISRSIKNADLSVQQFNTVLYDFDAVPESVKEYVKIETKSSSFDNISKEPTTEKLENIQDVNITATTLSKEFRMMKQGEIENHIKNFYRYSVYRVSQSNEFHIVNDKYVIVLKVSEKEATVITQMHKHIDYTLEDAYTKIV